MPASALRYADGVIDRHRGRLICVHEDHARSGQSLPFTSLSQLRAGPGRAVFLGGSPSEATALIELDLGTGTHRVIRRSAVLGDELRPYISVAQPVSFPTAGGETAHALYYPPLSPRFTAPAGEKAPVLVKKSRRADRVGLEHAVAGGAVLD